MPASSSRPTRPRRGCASTRERHARYVGAFAQQVQALAGLAQELATPAAGSNAQAAFVQKADACRTAALTLGSPRVEQLISDALALLAAGQAGRRPRDGAGRLLDRSGLAQAVALSQLTVMVITDNRRIGVSR